MGCNSCGKSSGCGCIPVGPMGERGPQGPTGNTGANGVGYRYSFISDGVTPIGNTIYPANTLVFQMTDLSYQSAGLLLTVLPLVWQPMTMLNGWTTNAGTSGAAEYAVSNGFIYIRGLLNGAAATDDTFTTISGITIPVGVYSNIIEYGGASMKGLLLNSSNQLRVVSRGTVVYVLDATPPISIR